MCAFNNTNGFGLGKKIEVISKLENKKRGVSFRQNVFNKPLIIKGQKIKTLFQKWLQSTQMGSIKTGNGT